MTVFFSSLARSHPHWAPGSSHRHADALQAASPERKLCCMMVFQMRTAKHKFTLAKARRLG